MRITVQSSKLTPSSRGYLESVLYSFRGGADTSQPVAMVSFRGNLFGVGVGGGSASKGVVFELALSESAYSESVLYSFKGVDDGAYPSKLLVDGNGNFYGITAFGGGGGMGYCSQGCGTVFKLSPASHGYNETVLHAFQGYSDGGFPDALASGASGALYGTTAAGQGTVFELLPGGSTYSDSVIYQFPGGPGGWYPTSLMVGSSGNLYGSLQNGGTHYGVCRGDYGCGTLYELQKTGSTYTETTLYQFTGGSDGAAPASLRSAPNGAFYGITYAGGRKSCNGGLISVAGCGTIFELTP